ECAEAGFFLRGAVGAYGLIFVDPPFSICREWTGGGGSGDIPINLVRLMEDDGVLILRLERGVNPPEWPGMSSIDKRCYGRSFVCRYRKSRPGEIGNPEKHPVFGGVPKIGRPGHEPGA
ncbi:MAG: RsmD family RNA methyltransferase, partial [Planctomycetota bacterium]|nr:RsmD family RNA methyltransferase [Planctomycetota bacterium]